MIFLIIAIFAILVFIVLFYALSKLLSGGGLITAFLKYIAVGIILWLGLYWIASSTGTCPTSDFGTCFIYGFTALPFYFALIVFPIIYILSVLIGLYFQKRNKPNWSPREYTLLLLVILTIGVSVFVYYISS